MNSMEDSIITLLPPENGDYTPLEAALLDAGTTRITMSVGNPNKSRSWGWRIDFQFVQ